ncbi:carboxypeptidase-like regulatory domain-containing protein [Fodinibius salsisoli]|uniref:Carboxypeptidase-like regulatory domain-containing protein n=1 Tax=Fodinibius salsisoli TaxID=2820877 RepID=A0ABT3PN20_9BACT|nr:carboxypeptidase-like regulatory domain-containing protein [Fodinibius salsisoli]MCW9707173.1 carboxypeptidase-like regulatory domain-containing protein [Fodinibius salsisoli]
MSSTKYIIIALLSPLLLWSCSKETVDPNFTGSIEGQVLHAKTGEPVINAEITTNPGTDVVLTDDSGQFSVADIPTGNYSIQVSKEGFVTKSVRISVNENRIASANVLLTEEDEEASSDNNISAEVTFFENFNYGPRDSIYVNVEYKFTNISASQRIGNYEVYFKIFTPGSAFYHEVPGDSLAVGEQSTGTFEKYIYQYEADSVQVSGVFAP